MENTGQLSRRKNQKVPIGERNEPSDDRLSSLPDPIICHILSFLPTKISVATSILGKRWRFLWTGVPCILLNSEDYKEEYGPPFSVIINGVLLLNNVQTMDTFRLFTVDYTEDMECHIETWIATLIARRIQNLELHFDSVYDCFPLNPVVLPRCLFTCETLVDLRLHGCGVTYPLPAKLCFPSLKKLDLCFVEYNGDSNLTDLISSCPVLEELFIDHFLEKGYFHCNIHSPTIKCLKVVFQLNDDREDDIFEPREYGLAINAPALRYLHVENAFSEYISAHMLTSLIEADIHLVDGWVDADIRRMNGMVDEIEYAESHSNLVEYFVNELCNVKCLKLSIHYVKDLKVTDSAFSFSTRKFNNLTKLELEADWHFLSMFLEIADNLEVLVIHKADFLRRWMEPQQVPTCLLSHLTNITIHLFQYVEYDFEMVRYLLMNAQVLKNMEIYSSHSHHVPAEVGKWKSWALERISEFERGSEECKLVFH